MSERDKPTKPESLVIIKVYEDSFEVEATGDMDMITLYYIFAASLEWIENYAEHLDKPVTTMLQ
jgi:hypothetical protein